MIDIVVLGDVKIGLEENEKAYEVWGPLKRARKAVE